MRNIKMVISYDGSAYRGFQTQANACSVQAELNRSLNRIFGEQISVCAASRTDAGVHAIEQVINVRTSGSIPLDSIPRAVNPILPPDIVVKSATEAPANFHSRYNAVKKIYIYKIYTSKISDPFKRNYYWQLRKMPDIFAMNEASVLLEGKHDFASFCAAGSSAKSTTRLIYSAKWYGHGTDIYFEICGKGFLHNMVRIIVGTCVDVGFGVKKAQDIKKIIQACNRKYAGKTAPPQGLYLMKVFYPEDIC